MGKIHLEQSAIPKGSALEPHAKKGGIVQGTVFKARGEQKGIAGMEIQSQHLAILENNLLEGGMGHIGMAQVTGLEPAFHKAAVVHIGLGKAALPENAAIIFPWGKGLYGIVPLDEFSIVEIGSLHGNN